MQVSIVAQALVATREKEPIADTCEATCWHKWYRAGFYSCCAARWLCDWCLDTSIIQKLPQRECDTCLPTEQADSEAVRTGKLC